MILIPLTNDPNSSFRVVIPQAAANRLLDFFLLWNRVAEYWQLSIGNATTGQALISNIPLLHGEAPVQNLLRQHEYLGLGAAYVVPLKPGIVDSPTVDSWGKDFALFWDPDA